MPNGKQIYLVDDDEAIRRSASFMLYASGYKVTAFESGVQFLESASELAPGCVLLDVRMLGLSGLEVQQALRERNVALPVIIMTGHGDITVALQAMNAGAVDFIEKPFDRTVVLEAIEDGLARLDPSGQVQRRARARARLEGLSSMETDILRYLVRGQTNTIIAQEFDLAPRKVEIHRANLMQKVKAASLYELLRIAFTAGLDSA